MKNILTTALLLLAANGGVNAQQPDDSLQQRIIESYAMQPQEKLYIQTDRPYYVAGDSLWFRIHLVDAATNIPSTSPLYPAGRSKYVYLELRGNAADTLVERAMIRRDTLGVFSNALRLPKDLKPGNYTLIAYTRHMIQFGKEHFAHKQVSIAGSGDAASIPSRPLQSIAITAMPEGGNLIAGFRQCLAFKAIGDDGLGVDVDVRLVREDDGEIVGKAKSTHLGMGCIYFVPKAGEKLWLEGYAAGGFSCRADVPDALEKGVSMHVDQRHNKLYVTPIISGVDPSRLSIAVYGSGNVIMQQRLSGKPLSISTAKMSPGVVNIAIVDTDKRQVLSERLAFIYPHDNTKVEMSIKR